MPVYLHALFSLHPTPLEVASYKSFVYCASMILTLSTIVITETKSGMLAAAADTSVRGSVVPAEVIVQEIKPHLASHSPTEIMHAIAADLVPRWMQNAAVSDLSQRNIALFIADALCEQHKLQFLSAPQTAKFCSFKLKFPSPYWMLYYAPPHQVPLRSSSAKSTKPFEDSIFRPLLNVVAPIASQWPRSWLEDFSVLGAFARTDLDTIVRVLKTSDDDSIYSICHTRQPALGFLATNPMQVVNHAFWVAQIIIALDAWRIYHPSLWSRQISEDGVRTHRPLLYGPLNDVRKSHGILKTPLGDLDPQLHPEKFREVCFSVRDRWSAEWPDSRRISGAISFFAVGRRGARRVRHYTGSGTRQSIEPGDPVRKLRQSGNKISHPERGGGASRLNIDTVRSDFHSILECDSQETLEHDEHDGESLAVHRSRHRALRLDRSCLRTTVNQPASDTLQSLIQLLKRAEEESRNPVSLLLVGLAIFTGRPFSEVEHFTVISNRAFQTGLYKTDRWFLRIVLPHPRPNGTTSNIDHELPELMQDRLTDMSSAPGSMFATPEEVETARQEITNYLSPYGKEVDLIHRAIIGEVRTLAAAGDGGVEAILGLNVGHATQAHYTVIELYRAKHIYRAACARLLGHTIEEAFKQDNILGNESDISRTQPPQIVISRTSVPRQAHVREFFEAEFESFKRLITPSMGRQERVDQSVFNGAVSFIVFIQSLLTANRPTHGVYVPRHLVDKRTGLMSHGDKTDKVGYERRLLYFPAELLQIMKCFESFADHWCEDRELVPYSKSVCLVREDGTPIGLSARVIENHWGSRFPFPANTPRRLHFAWLCGRGTSNLFRNMAMGHWTGGSEPWGQCSSLYFDEYLNWRRSTVAEILPDLGLPNLTLIAQSCRSQTAKLSGKWHPSPEGPGNAAHSEQETSG